VGQSSQHLGQDFLMTEKIILWTATIYVLFLAFISVKVGEYFEKKFLNKRLNVAYNAKRTTGFLVLVFALIPLRIFIPDFATVFFVMYVVISMIWGIIYFDYIAKDKDMN
jgi:ABC-type methionine transport system permease subunit